jgi:hypothetical protein
MKTVHPQMTHEMARALCEAGYMPVSAYIELCTEKGWIDDPMMEQEKGEVSVSPEAQILGQKIYPFLIGERVDDIIVVLLSALAMMVKKTAETPEERAEMIASLAVELRESVDKIMAH